MAFVKMEKDGDILIIGEAPQLVINLKTQDNYIQSGKKRIPYKRKVLFSEDLLQGKRENVLRTAADYYYRHACSVAQGIETAETYRSKANLKNLAEKEK